MENKLLKYPIEEQDFKVVLIDGYDNPLINTMENVGIHESHRNLLKSKYRI